MSLGVAPRPVKNTKPSASQGEIISNPEIAPAILQRRRHEIGVHGWVHEFWPDIADAAEEQRLLTRSIDYLTKAVGKRPVGVRAPGSGFSPHTFDLIRGSGFLSGLCS